MKQVLVIEDDVQIRENIQEILTLADLKPLVAENGLVGLRLARTHLPDLILCDVMMPEMNGYEVLSELRKDETLAMIPLVFLTAKADRSDQRQGMELGADDYLVKPFEPAELLRAIATRLERHATFSQKVLQTQQQAKTLQVEAKQHQDALQKSQQLSEIKTELLKKLTQDLRDPLSNINMAIHMLKRASSEQERDRYLAILQDECTREMKLLNELDYLQGLLTPENIKLLQRFKLINS